MGLITSCFMAHKRLEAAIQASQQTEEKGNIDDFIATHRNSSLRAKSSGTVTLPLDRWGIYSVKFNSNGSHLAVGFGNGGIYIVECDKKTVVQNLANSSQRGLAVTALRYFRADDTHLMSAGANGQISLWQLNCGQPGTAKLVASLFEEGNEINALDLCHDGRFFATVGKDRHVRLYDGNTFKLYETFLAPDPNALDETSVSSGHTQRVFALKFHPDDHNLFVTAGWDDCMKLWDKRFPKSVLKSINGSHVCGPGIDVRGNTILSGSWVVKNALQLWDLRSGTLTKNLGFPSDEQSGEYLYCAQFVSSSIAIAGGSGTNSACAIDFNQNKVVETYESSKPVLTVDARQSGRQVALAGIDGNLQIHGIV